MIKVEEERTDPHEVEHSSKSSNWHQLKFMHLFLASAAVKKGNSMVTTQYLKCLTCSAAYRIRAGVGFDNYQKHYMDCFECYTPIVFSVKTDDPPHAIVQAEENCVISEEKDPLVVNFHPNCAFDKDDIHDPMCFASMKLHRMIGQHLRVIESQRIQSIAHQFDIPNAPFKWGQLKYISKMISSKNIKKAARTASQYMNARNKDLNLYEHDMKYSFVSLMNEFLDWLFYPRINIITKPIIENLNELNDQGKLLPFYNYYKENLQNENYQRYVNIFSDFMARRDHFSQLMPYARIGNDDVDDKIISSKNFDSIRNYYGDAYETLTSNMTVLACINNIESGRNYDAFNSMTLKKYINDVSKEKKTSPFKDNPLLKPFCEDDLESTIRNGSHHASIWHDGESIRYRSGGTGAEREISYTKYMHLCNKLTLKIVSLWIIELHLQFIFESEDKEYPWFKI